MGIAHRIDSTDVANLAMVGVILDGDKSYADHLYFRTSTGDVQLLSDGSFLFNGVGLVPLNRMIVLGEVARKLQGYVVIP